MLFKSIAALALLAAPALAAPTVDLLEPRVVDISARDGLLEERQSKFISVKFYKYTTCGVDNAGPVRQYAAGTCLNLSESSHGVGIVDRDGANCKLVAYKNGNCSGGSFTMDEIRHCYDIGDAWYSLKFVC